MIFCTQEVERRTLFRWKPVSLPLLLFLLCFSKGAHSSLFPSSCPQSWVKQPADGGVPGQAVKQTTVARVLLFCHDVLFSPVKYPPGPDAQSGLILGRYLGRSATLMCLALKVSRAPSWIAFWPLLKSTLYLCLSLSRLRDNQLFTTPNRTLRAFSWFMIVYRC